MTRPSGPGGDAPAPGPAAPRDIGPAAAAAASLESLAGGPPVCVVLALTGPAAGRRLLVWAESVAGALGDPELDAAAIELARTSLRTGERGLQRPDLAGAPALFLDPVSAPDRLVVVGAGHIGVPLASLGAQLGFEVTVLDDRPEFASPERFPDGVRVLRCDFEGDPFAAVEIDERTCLALVTRGHAWDFDCLRLLLQRPARPRYIGMIGSRRRVRAALTALLDAGIPRERLAGLRAPIGLDIGAETPFEIAVSIAAELVQVRRGGSARPLTDREQVLARLLPEPPAGDSL